MLFKSSMTIVIGDGTRTKFWIDMWCGDHPLKDSLAALFRISSHESWVADFWNEIESHGHQIPHRPRNLPDKEMKIVQFFFPLLEGFFSSFVWSKFSSCILGSWLLEGNREPWSSTPSLSEKSTRQGDGNSSFFFFLLIHSVVLRVDCIDKLS